MKKEYIGAYGPIFITLHLCGGKGDISINANEIKYMLSDGHSTVIILQEKSYPMEWNVKETQSEIISMIETELARFLK